VAGKASSPTPRRCCACPPYLPQQGEHPADDWYARWNRSVLGLAEFTYPHPQSWTLHYAENATPLHRLRTRTLTEIIATKLAGNAPPSAHAAWEQKIGSTELPWHSIWTKVCHPLLTRCDTKNMFTILHRRVWNVEGARCPLCDIGEDRLSHITSCPYTVRVFHLLFPLDTSDVDFVVLGLRDEHSHE